MIRSLSTSFSPLFILYVSRETLLSSPCNHIHNHWNMVLPNYYAAKVGNRAILSQSTLLPTFSNFLFNLLSLSAIS